MKKAFSEVIFSNSFEREAKQISQKKRKKIFSRKSTNETIEVCKRMIENPQARKQTIAFIEAADGKKIRNTSGV